MPSKQKEPIKQIQWFNDHWYKVTTPKGEIAYYPSVTTKLSASAKPFLAQWRGDIGNAEADKRMHDAGNRGTRIHTACQKFLTGGIVFYNPIGRPVYSADAIMQELTKRNTKDYIVLQEQDEMWAVYKFQKWIEAVQPEVLFVEAMVCSHEFKEAGTLDLLLKIKAGEYAIAGAKPLKLPAGVYVADIKSGKSISDESFMQVAAYANMVKAEYNPIGTLILHLSNEKIRTGIQGMSTYYRSAADMVVDFRRFRNIATVWEDSNEDMVPKLFEFPSMIVKD